MYPLAEDELCCWPNGPTFNNFPPTMPSFLRQHFLYEGKENESDKHFGLRHGIVYFTWAHAESLCCLHFGKANLRMATFWFNPPPSNLPSLLTALIAIVLHFMVWLSLRYIPAVFTCPFDGISWPKSSGHVRTVHPLVFSISFHFKYISLYWKFALKLTINWNFGYIWLILWT